MSKQQRAVYLLILKGIVAILRCGFTSKQSLAAADEIEHEMVTVFSDNYS